MESKHILKGNVPIDIAFMNWEDGSLTPRMAGPIFNNKNVLVFGLPGAFTPTCSTQQLPGYEELYSQFKDEGIDEIYCTSVNDGFVMKSWFDAQGIENVRPLSDGNGKFARFMGMLVQKDNLGFGMRSWRYAAVIRNGEVTALFCEDGLRDNHDQDPYEHSKPENVLEAVKGMSFAPLPTPSEMVEAPSPAPQPTEPVGTDANGSPVAE